MRAPATLHSCKHLNNNGHSPGTPSTGPHELCRLTRHRSVTVETPSGTSGKSISCGLTGVWETQPSSQCKGAGQVFLPTQRNSPGTWVEVPELWAGHCRRPCPGLEGFHCAIHAHPLVPCPPAYRCCLQEHGYKDVSRMSQSASRAGRVATTLSSAARRFGNFQPDASVNFSDCTITLRFFRTMA